MVDTVNFEVCKTFNPARLISRGTAARYSIGCLPDKKESDSSLGRDKLHAADYYYYMVY